MDAIAVVVSILLGEFSALFKLKLMFGRFIW